MESIGPKIGIDGEVEFRRQIQQINQEFQTLVSQTKSLTAAFDANDDEQGKLRATGQQLEKQIEAQEKKMALLRKGVGDAGKKYDEAKEKTSSLEKELEKAKTELSKTKAAMDHAGDASGDLEEQFNAQKAKVEALEKQLSKATGETHNADIASQKWQQTLYEGEAKLSGLIKGLAQTDEKLKEFEVEAVEASAGAEDLGDEAQEAGDNLEEAGQSALKFGDILKANLISDAIMAGMRKLGELAKNFASGVIESTASVQAENAQFAQTFADLEDQAKSSLESISTNVGIASTRMQASYTKIYAFAKTAGSSSSEALGLAQRAMVAAADSAAYYDRSIEDATETLQSFLKGNYANDAALGIAATETTRNTMANKLYAKSFQQLSESQKVDVLLSMVEAGNEASGAIGQAARESDAWENVTGELNEAQRQLQATLGKPVMKNLIPVIQKLTKKINELATSGDLEEFAESLGDSLGWIIDNGPEIVRAVGSITAGYLAFKAVTKAKQLVDLATGFAKMGTAAVAASTGIAASGAALNATPWGAIATAVGAVVGVVTALVSGIKESSKEVDQLTQKTQAMVEGVAESEASYKDTETQIYGTMEAARQYANRLQELEQVGLNTAVSQREYATAVESLNQLIPDLNLKLDEQTGKVIGGVDAIYKQVDAWKDLAIAEAMYTNLQDKLDLMNDAIVEMYDNQVKLDNATKDGAKIRSEIRWREMTAGVLQRKINEIYKDETLSINAANEAAGNYESQLTSLTAELQKWYDKQRLNQGEQDKLTKKVSDCDDKIKEHQQDIDNTAAAYQSFGEQVFGAGFALDGFGQKAEDSGDTVTGSLQQLQQKYVETYSSAYESITKQIGLFDDLSGKCDMTFDDMLNNLDSQISAFSNYADNIKLAAERGIDQGLIQQLSDGSVESMQILEVLVNGTDEQIRELAEKMRLKESEQRRVAGSIAEINTKIKAELAKMKADARKSAEDIVQGLVDGISASSAEYYEAMKDLALKGQRTFTRYEMIASPSKVYRKFAGYDVAGLVEGFRHGEKDVREAVARLAKAGQSQMSAPNAAWLKNADFSLPIPPGAAEFTAGGGATRNINLGGISIRVNAPNITDPEQLADIIADKINNQVQRRVSTYA